MDLGSAWSEIARRHGDRIALIDDAGSWSYRNLQARIARFGNALRGIGLRKGDRVALLVPDIREYLEADYAAMAAGLVRVPLDPRLRAAELAAALRHAGARALVTHASFEEQTAGVLGQLESLEHLVTIGGGAGLDYEALLERGSEQLQPQAGGEDVAALAFSGGTSGAPKAAMLRHRNLVAVARNTIEGFEIGIDSVFLNVRPLWPIAQVIVMSHLFAGAKVVLGRFDPDALAAWIERSGATRTSLVPTQLVRWLDHLRPDDPRLARLEAVHVGGSRIAPDAFERALRLLGPRIGVLYGLTEAPVTCYLPPRALEAPEDVQRRLIGSVGRVLPEYELRISDHDEAVSVGRSGEVLIRGGNVMAGYWQDDAATAAALRDGWLHTGDIGEVDSAGNLFIVGRRKDVIRSGSSTIVPQEVEDVLALHPAVAEVAVLGLPDPEWGEAVTAFVVARPGASVDARDLVEHCRTMLASYKKPRAIRFVTSLPRSHYGKVLRAQLLADAGV